MPSPAASIASSHRETRAFLSSTFRDMQEEREELVKQIFPQLRRLCQSRGVMKLRPGASVRPLTPVLVDGTIAVALP